MEEEGLRRETRKGPKLEKNLGSAMGEDTINLRKGKRRMRDGAARSSVYALARRLALL